ncbi:MAG: hypothetical protein ACTHJJ_04770 [Intrasporangium sp.]|uniref:hypothetical protein n=1 Tax=Intrasporangium sp. TaxID=1925024 RepID=UPI003F7D1E9F
MNIPGDITFAKAEMDYRYGLRDRHRDRPESSLAVIARTMRRQRWEESHPGRTR